MKHLDSFMIQYRKRFDHPHILPVLQKIVDIPLSQDKITFVEHHEAHALSPVYFY